MSFIDDVLSGLDVTGTPDVSAAQIAANTQSGVYNSGSGFSLSSALQGFLTVGTGYAKGLSDLSLAKQAVQVQRQAQQPAINSTQSPIYFGSDLTTRGAGALGSMRVGNLLPFILLGVGAYVLLGKKG
ncbi:hypothetical protein [Aquabacterium sp.]|uniref:hypothetical protein n=1 Tax=Aquabacterium sp. TaxID=1872578 RepID=UPI0025BA7771|nr:hypothetical protein [Aquabacterium sp.]